MKALTKGQYEGIAKVIRGRVENHKPLSVHGYTDHEIDTLIDALDDLVVFLAHEFALSDPEFKRELFLELCGVTE